MKTKEELIAILDKSPKRDVVEKLCSIMGWQSKSEQETQLNRLCKARAVEITARFLILQGEDLV